MAFSTLMHASVLALLAANAGLPRAPTEQPQVRLTIVLGSGGTAHDEPVDILDPDAFEVLTGANRDEAPRSGPADESGMASSAEPPGEPLMPPEPITNPPRRSSPDTFGINNGRAVTADLSTAGLLDAPPQPTPLLVAVPKPLVTAPPVPEKIAAYSSKQESMLVRKSHDWAHSYHQGDQPDAEVAWEHKGQRYTARFTSIPGDDDTQLDRVAVRVTTEQNGERLSMTMRLTRLAFSNYAQFVNRWDDSVQIHDDELDGRFHANSEINLSYSRDVAPRFHGKVTTSARSINITDRHGYRSRDEIFLGGLETGVGSIRLPRDYVPLPASMAIRDEQLHEFPEDTRITFHKDGSYSWLSSESGQFEQRGTIRQPASYLIATNKAELHLKGTVAGKVLVFSPNRIVIIGDLTYATDPEGPNGSDDYLGIVSERTVEIAEPSITGPGDLHIDAAIYARRLFRVREYRQRDNAMLDIYGSLTAGSVSATEPRYATRIRFDPRLESRRPPGFPVTDRYELESWDAAWTVEP
jgi:hypothetical protein